MLKFFALVLIVSGTNAAWTSCNLPGVPSPDKIVSEYCPNDRCVATIGTTFKADFFFTPVNVHYQLRTKATGYFTIGPGVPVSISNQPVCIQTNLLILASIAQPSKRLRRPLHWRRLRWMPN